MTNLVAYIPVPNRQYLDWIRRHRPANVYVIHHEIAAGALPSLGRNMIAVHASEVVAMLKSVNYIDVRSVDILSHGIKLDSCVMPDEDLSHALVRDGMITCPRVTFEPIWARWDMKAVIRQQPIIPDVVVTSATNLVEIMDSVVEHAKRSPDWWRQVGAMAQTMCGKQITAYNRHLPTEYEVVVHGDPRINFNAGDPAGANVYLSLHAEKGVIVECVKMGVSLKGADFWATTFPCGDCARMLAMTGISRLFFREGYSMLEGLQTLRAARIQIVQVK